MTLRRIGRHLLHNCVEYINIALAAECIFLHGSENFHTKSTSVCLVFLCVTSIFQKDTIRLLKRRNPI